MLLQWNRAKKTLDMIVNLCKNRGYVFPGSEIYGGLANSWDYGPLGVEFKNNVKKAWLKKFVQESPYNVGLDAAIIMNPQTWITTGHVAGFSDPLLDCRACKARHRADKLIGDEHPEVNVDAMSFDEMDQFIAEHEDIVCPVCGKHDFTPIRKFNLMFKTAIGVTEDSSSTCYLRPETAQGIFVNFANIQRTTRRKLPFGVCQVGKAFRNEITPGNFTFRTREFEQMECEFFCKPGTDLEWFAYWKDYCENWLLSLGIQKEHLRLRDHEPAELAFYSRATTDIEYAFPFTDWGELWGIADRTNYDLSRHQEASGKSLEYFDSETNEHYIPYVIEPSLGCDRVALAFLCEAYDEEHLVDAKGKEDVRTVLHLHPALAPYKCAVLPLSKKLGDKAMEIRNELSKYFMVDYDDTGSIGKRYRREDEIGTPYCITVDFDTVGDEAKGIAADNCVTVRDRDTMEQVRMPISELKSYIESKDRVLIKRSPSVCRNADGRAFCVEKTRNVWYTDIRECCPHTAGGLAPFGLGVRKVCIAAPLTLSCERGMIHDAFRNVGTAYAACNGRLWHVRCSLENLWQQKMTAPSLAHLAVIFV